MIQTDEDIIRMAREAGFVYAGEDFQDLNIVIERFAALVASAEREACAKVCESYTDESDSDHETHGYACAIAIRARGQA
jgi:hypothetical protein